MLKGKIANTETYDFKADGTEKTAEEKAAFMFKYQSEQAIEKALKNFTDNSPEFKALSELKAKVETLKPNDEGMITKLREDLNSVSVELKALKEIGAPKTNKGLAETLKEKKVEIKSIATGNDTHKEIVVPGLERKTLTQRSSIAGNSQALDLMDIGQLATRKLSLYDLFTKIPLSESNNNGVIRYRDWDKDTITRAAAAVAEGAVFPESKAQFLQATISLQKIGDTLPVTEEFFEDEAMFAGELDFFLNTNVALEIDRQLYAGDGTSNTMVGIVASVPAYTNATTPTFQFANIYDLIIDASKQITQNGGAKYTPDFVIMNIADINKMRATKSTFGTYVIPPFVSPDGMNVAGIQIVESNIVTANTMVIGDRRFAKIYEKGGIVLSKGLVNTQFTYDEMTLKARKRMAFLIRSADANGFLKITDITTSVAALAIPAP